MVACLPFTNVSGKSGWKVNGTCLFWVVPGENFREQRNICKGSPVFSGRNIPIGNSRSISSKPSVWYHWGLRGRFPVNRTDLICTNCKRDSGAKLTSPEFLRTICLNRGPTGLPMQMVNNSNQCECVPLARAPLLFARQNVFLFNKGERNLLYNRTKQSRLDWSASSATIFIGRF